MRTIWDYLRVPAWLAKYGSEDFRKVVTTHLDFLFDRVIQAHSEVYNGLRAYWMVVVTFSQTSYEPNALTASCGWSRREQAMLREGEGSFEGAQWPATIRAPQARGTMQAELAPERNVGSLKRRRPSSESSATETPKRKKG